jgi:hypothetical protein
VRWAVSQLLHGYKCAAELDHITRVAVADTVAETVADQQRPWWEQLGLEDIQIGDRDHGDECVCERCA